jgi:hypothetical protein
MLRHRGPHHLNVSRRLSYLHHFHQYPDYSPSTLQISSDLEARPLQILCGLDVLSYAPLAKVAIHL